jgi:predicted dehydrogenase
MSDDALSVGLVGFGLAGRVFHAPLITSTPGLRLAAVVTRDTSRAAAITETYPGTEVVADVGALLARDVDLVVVASTNPTHANLTVAALEAGVPVVVDKPLARSVAEAERMIAASQATGVPFTVFQNRRWDGDFLTARALVEDGTLGTVRRFESRFEQWRPQLSGNWRESGDPELAAGVLLDFGAHLVDQAMELLGPVVSVYAEVDSRRSPDAADDDAFIALSHHNGSRSHLWASAVASDLGPRLRIIGDRASYTVHGLDGQEPALAAGMLPTDPGWGETPAKTWGVVGTPGDVRPEPTRRGSYDVFYRKVAQAVRAGSPMPVDPRSAVAALAVLVAAQTSARERRVVNL